MASEPLNNGVLIGIESYPDLAKLVDHCRHLAGDRAMPHRKDFVASKVRWMFAHLYLVDVVDEGADYRCRLWGQFWETIFGVNLQGKSLSDLERTGNLLHLRAEYDAIVAARCVHFRAGRVIWPDGTSAEYARVIVPFAGDDGNVSMLLSAATCDKAIDDLVFFKGLGVPSFAYKNE